MCHMTYHKLSTDEYSVTHNGYTDCTCQLTLGKVLITRHDANWYCGNWICPNNGMHQLSEPEWMKGMLGPISWSTMTVNNDYVTGKLLLNRQVAPKTLASMASTPAATGAIPGSTPTTIPRPTGVVLNEH